MNKRQMVRAGMFYQASHRACRDEARALFDAAQLPGELPVELFGGLVPHAGWAYSGLLAAMTFKALLTARASIPAGDRSRVAGPGTLVMFGADHSGTARMGDVWDKGAWASPLGDVGIDEKLADELLGACDLLQSNPASHAEEHSIEVQLPLIKAIAPDVLIVPITVPPAERAVEIGRAVGKTLAARSPGHPGACVVGSTDLTHHGGHFGSPGGSGQQSEFFTRRNDRRMLDLIELLDAEAIVPEAHQRDNACGVGAIAATVAAVREMGAAKGKILSYTNSYEITHKKNPHEPDDTTVGYASVVFL